MPVRPLALAVAAVALALPAAPAAAAAPAAGSCPTAYRLVTAQDLRTELRTALQDQKALLKEALGGLEPVLASLDANGDGRVCQQVDSFGRAPGQPAYYSNFVDNRLPLG